MGERVHRLPSGAVHTTLRSLRFGALWLVATTFAVPVGTAFARMALAAGLGKILLSPLMFLFDAALKPFYAGFDLFAFELVGGLDLRSMAVRTWTRFAVGLAVGLAQGLVLRRHVPVNWWWVGTAAGLTVGEFLGVVLATIFREPLALALMDRMSEPLVTWMDLYWGSRVGLPAAALGLPRVMAFSGIVGGVAGIVVGGFQWMILRRVVSRAGLLVVANALGYVLGLLAYDIVLPLVGLPLARGWLVSSLTLGLTVGLISGAALLWLLQDVRAARQGRQENH